jgi:hypothetical protein
MNSVTTLMTSRNTATLKALVQGPYAGNEMFMPPMHRAILERRLRAALPTQDGSVVWVLLTSADLFCRMNGWMSTFSVV